MNLLLLYCKYSYYDLAADILAENAELTYKNMKPEEQNRPVACLVGGGWCSEWCLEDLGAFCDWKTMTEMIRLSKYSGGRALLRSPKTLSA